MMRIGLFLLSTCFATVGWGHQKSVMFDSRAMKESGSLVLNLERSALHTPLYIKEFVVSGIDNREMPVGDGRHGAFIPANYRLFSQGGDLSGQIIRLPLDDFYPLQVTEFHLAAGWTLEPVGDAPLEIYSQGHVLIEGTINCSGMPGQDGVLNAGAQPSQGGAGRCGGKRGGNGGAVGVNPEPGEDALPTAATGGFPGQQSVGNGGAGGGGGGGYHSNVLGLGAAWPGANAPGAFGGPAGVSDDSDDEVAFKNLVGGAGGGGGGFHANSSGGAGGGGGGVVVIYSAGSLHVTATGQVLAEGGAGGLGVVDGLAASGDGGAGGGGAILMASAHQVPPQTPLDPTWFNRIDGTVSAGEDNLIVSGAGGAGRTWLATSSAGDPFGYFGVDPVPLTFRVYQGEVEYHTGSYNFVSVPMSIGVRKPIFSSLTLIGVENEANGTIEVKVRGADTLAELAAQPFELIADAPSTEDMRYFQVQVTITNNSGTQPISLQGVQVEFDLGEIREFNYVGQCSQVTPPPGSSSWMGLLWLILMLLPIAVTRLALHLKGPVTR